MSEHTTNNIGSETSAATQSQTIGEVWRAYRADVAQRQARAERLSRVTLNIPADAMGQIGIIEEEMGSKTDAIIKAIRAGGLVLAFMQAGFVVSVEDPTTGEKQGLIIL